MFRTQSISQRLFISYGFLVLNIVIITLLALYYLRRTSDSNDLGERYENQRLLIARLIGVDLDFLRFETVNVHYFKTGSSKLLDERMQLLEAIRREQLALRNDPSAKDFLGDFDVAVIDKLIGTYDQTFQLLLNRISTRGFKDFGVEGVMREYAHSLEDKDGITLAELLTLRRHEKDFLLRKEIQYVDKFNSLADDLLVKLQHTDRSSTTANLSAYQKEFNHLTYLIYEIGVEPRDGMLGHLNLQATLIADHLAELNVVVNKRKADIITESAIWFGIISAVLIVASCVLTYFTSTLFARPIKRLSATMGKFMVNEGLNENDLADPMMNDEISSLTSSFIKMSRKLKSQFSEILKQNTELKTLNEELDRFIYSAAHDLKSPLASLDGLVHLAEREINSPEHHHYFQMMSGSVRKLNGFIQDITDYAKNKRQAVIIEKVDIEAMIRDTVESLRFLPYADRVSVHVRVDGKDFYTDKTRFEIILKNLIGNSFRYMDFTKNKSYIRIEGTVYDQHLRMSIEDNGIGIGEQHLGKIFQMFYRAVEHSKGTGIGLFLVKESVKMLHGKIGVKSRLGEWTVFHLKIPNFKQGAVSVPEPADVIEDTVVLH